MSSNPFSRDQQRIRQLAQRTLRTAAEQGQAPLSDRTAVKAGTFDADGNFSTYGRIGITPIGAGFKIRGV